MSSIPKLSFLIITLALCYTLYLYSKEGDIGTLTGSTPSAWKLKKLYPNQENKMKRLHDLIIYKDDHIKWNRFMVIAVFAASLIVYNLVKKFDPTKIIVTTLIVFLAIDLPNRWASAHVKSATQHEATMLCAQISDSISARNNNGN